MQPSDKDKPLPLTDTRSRNGLEIHASTTAAKKSFFTESELVEGIHRKNKQAFYYLYDHYSPALYGVILRILKQEQAAEMVLHKSFNKIFTAISDYNVLRGRLFTWMLAIARSYALEQVQKEKEILKAYANDEAESFPNANLNSLAVKEQMLILSKEDHLPILDMVYFSGRSFAEISRLLQIPAETVKIQLRSAFLQLSLNEIENRKGL